MKTKTVVPLFTTDELEATRDFYTRHLGFRVHVAMDGYVSLKSGERCEIGFMKPTTEDCSLARGAGPIRRNIDLGRRAHGERTGQEDDRGAGYRHLQGRRHCGRN